VDKLKEPHKEMQLWTPKEAAHFLDAIQGHRLYALFYLAMSTGMRRGELLGLRWQDVQEGSLTIKQTLVPVGGKAVISTPKTAKGIRRIAISPDAQAALEEHRKRQRAERRLLGDAWTDTGLVFTSEIGTPIYPRNLERTWYALQDMARTVWRERLAGFKDEAIIKALDEGKLFPRLRLHDLRHLHASLMIKDGCDVKVLAERLGHANASLTLDIYTHLFEEQRKASAVSLTDLLGGDHSPEELN
jgi:integrase